MRTYETCDLFKCQCLLIEFWINRSAPKTSAPFAFFRLTWLVSLGWRSVGDGGPQQRTTTVTTVAIDGATFCQINQINEKWAFEYLLLVDVYSRACVLCTFLLKMMWVKNDNTHSQKTDVFCGNLRLSLLGERIDFFSTACVFVRFVREHKFVFITVFYGLLFMANGHCDWCMFDFN